ncbi:hypothetical protein M0811_07950 [Anaeramoeba ignava]|uniref:L-type lectin-like domain-containing protein n=1 Tax=Anaeramoeba ignava TaxID=1746090 RepID=A0A9Q0RC91_ANAIG|nr:hypothetical protein M0811_07950 [Anaeramoeba ignava]
MLQVVINDGNLVYNGNKDGMDIVRGFCELSPRNLGKESQIKITYFNNILNVEYDLGSKGEWIKCSSISNVDLPTGYYFGVSARTGGLSDKHELISILTMDLTPSKYKNEKKDYQEIYVENLDIEIKDEEDEEENEEEEEILTMENVLLIKKKIENKIEDLKTKKYEEKDYLIDFNEETKSILKAVNNVISIQKSTNSLKEKIEKTLNQQLKTNEELSSSELIQKFQEEFSLMIKTISEEKSEIDKVIIGLNELKEIIIEDDKKERPKMINEVNILKDKVQKIPTIIESTKKIYLEIVENYQGETEKLPEGIEKRKKIRYWIILFILEIVFGAAFLYWKKMNEDESKFF